MAWRLFQAGNDIGEAKKVHIIPDQQQFITNSVFGHGSGPIPDLKGPCRARFESDIWVEIGANLELREDGGRRLSILADQVTFSSTGGAIVTGKVQSQKD